MDIPQTAIRIGVVRSTGTGLRHLPGFPGIDEFYGQGDPAWAPGGRSFAFSAQPEVGTDGTACCPSIYAAQTDRTGLRRLTSPMRTPAAPFPGDDEPAWSPSGEIAFARATNYEYGRVNVDFSARAIYVMKPDGSGLRRLTRGYDPDWAPDGRHIAFSRGEDVYIARSDGSGLRRLTRNGGGDPAWSPDGKWIAFVRAENDSTEDLYVVRTNGSRLRRIANGRFSTALDGPVVYGEPSWQPRR